MCSMFLGWCGVFVIWEEPNTLGPLNVCFDFHILGVRESLALPMRSVDAQESEVKTFWPS
jgi:hypothetical protein